MKWSPNATKLHDDLLWARRKAMGPGCTWGSPKEGITYQGAPGGPGAPWWVVLPSEHPPEALLRPAGCLLVQKNPQKVSLRLDSVWY